MSSAETFLPLLPMLLCIRNRASIYCQFSYTHAPRQDAVSILKFQEGDGVCWVMGFRYSEVPLTFMGQGCMCTCVCMWTCVGPSMCVHMWAHVLDRGCVCVCVCMWTCVGPRTTFMWRVQGTDTLYSGVSISDSCWMVFLVKKRKKKARFPFQPRAGTHMFSSKSAEVSEKQIWINKCQQVFSPNGIWFTGRSSVGMFPLPKSYRERLVFEGEDDPPGAYVELWWSPSFPLGYHQHSKCGVLVSPTTCHGCHFTAPEGQEGCPSWD